MWVVVDARVVVGESSVHMQISRLWVCLAPFWPEIELIGASTDGWDEAYFLVVSICCLLLVISLAGGCVPPQQPNKNVSERYFLKERIVKIDIFCPFSHPKGRGILLLGTWFEYRHGNGQMVFLSSDCNGKVNVLRLAGNMILLAFICGPEFYLLHRPLN